MIRKCVRSGKVRGKNSLREDRSKERQRLGTCTSPPHFTLNGRLPRFTLIHIWSTAVSNKHPPLSILLSLAESGGQSEGPSRLVWHETEKIPHPLAPATDLRASTSGVWRVKDVLSVQEIYNPICNLILHPEKFRFANRTRSRVQLSLVVCELP